MFFLVVGLIGTGWAFIKPILSPRDQTLFLIVLPLQPISNVAMIVMEETAPGTRGWFAWISLLRPSLFLSLSPSPLFLSLSHSLTHSFSLPPTPPFHFIPRSVPGFSLSLPHYYVSLLSVTVSLSLSLSLFFSLSLPLAPPGCGLSRPET